MDKNHFLIKNYFNLDEEDKQYVLCELTKTYMDTNKDKGFSLTELVYGLDCVIERANDEEYYELSQAFVDIKQALDFIVKDDSKIKNK